MAAGPHVQRDSGVVADWWRFEEDPPATEWKRVGDGRWSPHGAESLHATGRLIGGCVETLCNLAGWFDIPIVLDLEIGHVPPHLPLLNGALATVTVDNVVHEVVQELV